MPTESSTRAPREPRQRRSRATLERIVGAASRLLDLRLWDRITVAELVREAGTSVGAFYARFPDKEALLEHLDERYAREMTRFVERIAVECESAPDLDTAVRRLTRRLVVFHRERAGLLRTLVLRARTLRLPTWEERTRRMNAATPTLVAAIRTHVKPTPGADPARACFNALAFTFSALRERVLFPESLGDPWGTDDDELADELARLMLAYLRERESR